MREMFWSCYQRDLARALYINSFHHCCFKWAVQPTPHQKPPLVSPLNYIRKQQVASIEKMDCGICAAAIEESIQGDSKIENGKLDIVFGSAEQWLSDQWRNVVQFGAHRQTKVLQVENKN